MKNIVMLAVILSCLGTAVLVFIEKQSDVEEPPLSAPGRSPVPAPPSPPIDETFVPQLPIRTYPEALAFPEAELAERIAALTLAVQVLENDDRRASGDQFARLPAAAIPHLRKLLERNDLSWVAIAAITKGIELIERRESGKQMIDSDAELLRWHRGHLVDAYRRHGKRDARWDRAIIEALELKSLQNAGTPTFHQGIPQQIVNLLEPVIRDGCDDPIVLHSYMNCSWALGMLPPKEIAPSISDGFQMAARRFEASPYSHFSKAWGYLEAGRATHFEQAGRMDKLERDTPPDPIAVRWVERGLEEFKIALKNDNIPADAAIAFSNYYLDARGSMGNERDKGYEQLKGLIAEHYPEGGDIESLYGQYLIDWAWDARGYGFSNTVTDDGARKFNDRLRLAVEHLSKSAKRFPNRATFPAKLMKVGLGLGFTREAMNLHLRDVVRHNPDGVAALGWMVNYELPRYYGDAESCIAFGRQCLLTGNWEGRLPEMLVGAHFVLAPSGGDDEAAPNQDPDYFKEPEVWKDIEVVCEEMLKWHPGDRTVLSLYAIAAHGAEKWDLAFRLFEQLGDNPDYRHFKNRKSFLAMKTKVQTIVLKPPPIDPALTTDDTKLGEMMVTLRWHLDYFSPGAQARRRGEWSFTADGRMSDGHQPNWKIENGILETYSDNRSTLNRWRFNATRGRWENLTNATPDNGKGAYVVPIGRK